MFKVLGRLSFAMYIMHYPLIFLVNAMPVSLIHFSVPSSVSQLEYTTIANISSTPMKKLYAHFRFGNSLNALTRDQLCMTDIVYFSIRSYANCSQIWDSLFKTLIKNFHMLHVLPSVIQLYNSFYKIQRQLIQMYIERCRYLAIRNYKKIWVPL